VTERRDSIGGPAAPATRSYAWLWLVAAPLFWAGNFALGRALRGELPPISLNFWRWALALAILLPLTAGELRRERAALLRAWPLVLALGVTGVALYQILAYYALSLTTAISASLVGATAPLTIAVGAWLAFRDRVTRRQLLGLLAALVGAAAVIVRGDFGALLALRLNPGDLLMVGGVLTWTVYSLLLKLAPRGLSALALLTASALAGLAVMAPLYLWRVAEGERIAPTLPNLLGVGYTALFASVLAFIGWSRGVAALGPGRAAGFINLLPIFTALLSVLLLGEPVAPYHLVGALLVLGGVALGSRAPAPTPMPAAGAKGEITP
jgi:drug/metabolite transporter (DMT)-like permease